MLGSSSQNNKRESFNTISHSIKIHFKEKALSLSFVIKKRRKNEKGTFLMTLLVMGVSFAFAQTNADIKFDKTTHDFGKFSENSPVVSCTFTFTNIGDAPW